MSLLLSLRSVVPCSQTQAHEKILEIQTLWVYESYLLHPFLLPVFFAFVMKLADLLFPTVLEGVPPRL